MVTAATTPSPAQSHLVGSSRAQNAPMRKQAKKLLYSCSQRPVIIASIIVAISVIIFVGTFFYVTPPVVVWEATAKLSESRDVERIPRFNVLVFVEAHGTVTSDRLLGLLQSLSNASYPNDEIVGLDVHLHTRSWSSSGSSLQNPASVSSVNSDSTSQKKLDSTISEFEWPHGPKSIAVCSKVNDWHRILQNSSSSHVFIFADMAVTLAPNYFHFALQAMSLVDGVESGAHALGGPILAVSLDSVLATTLKNDSRRQPTNRLTRTSVFFPASSGFVPTPESWDVFLRWLKVQSTNGVEMPIVPDVVLSAPDFSRTRDIRAWFSHYVAAYAGHVLHPSGETGDILVVRDPAGTLRKDEHEIYVRAMQGASVVKSSSMFRPMHLLSKHLAKDCCILQQPHTYLNLHLPPYLDTNHPDGKLLEQHVVPLSSQEVAHGIVPLPVLPGRKLSDNAKLLSAFAHDDSVRLISRFGRLRGNGTIAFTIVTSAFLETTCSWICNALSVNALPEALVFGASGADVVQSLNRFVEGESRIRPGAILVVDLGADISSLQRAKFPQAALDFGRTEYWMLMLERTALLRDVLNAGVGILHFETDQIWFQDPMPWVLKLLSGPDQFGQQGQSLPPVDMVLTVNTRKEASGNFFYLRPSLPTRHLWTIITTAFQRSYGESLLSYAAKKGKFHYIDNDQSLLTQYALGHNNWYNRNFPVARYAVLDRQRFVDGTWYLDFEDEKGRPVRKRWYYTSSESLHPIILNNNFMIGVEGKKKRAQRFGHWFLSSESGKCNVTVSLAGRL